MERACSHCGAALENRLIDFEKWVNGNKLVVPEIPAAVCTGCGEKYIHSSNYARIEEYLKQYVDLDFVLKNNVATVRKSKKLTQEVVAARIGISTQRYGKIEKQENPSIRTALKVALALEADVNEIFCLKQVLGPYKTSLGLKESKDITADQA